MKRIFADSQYDLNVAIDLLKTERVRLRLEYYFARAMMQFSKRDKIKFKLRSIEEAIKVLEQHYDTI